MIYADSSVIVKRYYAEPGSAQVREAWLTTERVFTSWVAYAEVVEYRATKNALSIDGRPGVPV